MKKDKPIIGIDGNEANVLNRVGVNNYAYEVLNNIQKLEDQWNEHFQILVYLKASPLPHMPRESKDFKYRILPGAGQWILKTLMPHLYLSKLKPTIFWSPSHYVPPFAPMPRVCSIMDLGYLEFSEQFKKYDFWQLKLWTAWSMLISQKVIAISETTRKDIIKRYSFARGKTVTTLLGYDTTIYPPKPSSIQIKEILQKYSIGRNYLLFMSTLKPSKNIEGLLKAWALVEKKYPDTQLVVAGKKGWLFESIFAVVKKYKLESRVIFTDFVAEEDKPILISQAKAFVLPSFWEGFGLDVVSSMACGIPTIVSDRGSLPEVVGNVGFVVNPEDVKAIGDAMSEVLSASTTKYKALSDAAKERSTNFSWKKTAKETIEVLRSLL